MPVEVKCQLCGTPFETYPSELKVGKGKYCSRVCYDKKRGSKIKRICEVCGKEFKIAQSIIKVGKGKYCSRECNDISRITRVKRVCKCCGKHFEIELGRFKLGYGIYCSAKCKDKANAGENNPNWKGGISYGKYCPKFNNEFKERVRNHFDRTCMICGKPESEYKRKLDVHHINYDKMVCCNDNIPMFLPLCRSCHTLTTNHRDYFEEVLTNFVMVYFDGFTFLPK